MPLNIPPPLIEGISHMRIAQAFKIFIQSFDITARMMTELRLKADQPEAIIRPNVHQYGILDAAPPRDLVKYGYQAAEQAIPRIRRELSWSNNLIRHFQQKLHTEPKKPPIGKIRSLRWSQQKRINEKS